MDAANHSSDRWIPWAIILFFVFFMVLLSSFAWIAFHTYTGETTHDAYKKGLAYNAAIDSANAQARLGWKTTLQTTSHDNALDIAITIKDSTGHIISDANVIAHISRMTQAGHDADIVLRYDNGSYRGTAQLDFPGAWDVRLSATRGTDNYQESKSIVMQ